MKTAVALKNITYGCGNKFLEKGRIIAFNENKKLRIYRNNEDYNNDEYSYAPIDEDEFLRYFRYATQDEEKLFFSGIKSINQQTTMS